MRSNPRVAVVGATGAVGTVMLKLLHERNFPASEIVPFASQRSAGRELEGGLIVSPLSDETIQGFDIAIFSAGATISREWCPKFAAAGAVVIDNSSAWRRDPDIPLVVSEVNPEAIAMRDRKGIIANPNCSTMQMLVALKPIHEAVGIERLVVTTFQAVSGTGVAAVEELKEQARAVLDGTEVPSPAIYPHRVAFNVIAAAGGFAEGDDYTDEERKLIFETRKILGDESINVSATCTRVPVVNCHSEAVNIQTKQEISPDEVRELLRSSPGVEVIDQPSEHGYPTVLDADGQDGVFVGRIRKDPSADRALNMWVVGDNLRKGAATNAVQIAELLIQS